MYAEWTLDEVHSNNGTNRTIKLIAFKFDELNFSHDEVMIVIQSKNTFLLCIRRAQIPERIK